MTSKLKCPFCQTGLEQMHDKKMLGCPKCLHIADGAFWTKAIQAKQDLVIATKALEEISSHYQDEMGKPTFVDWYLSAKKMCDCADKALETIGKHNE